jgi:hypothetical protein
MIIKTLFKNTIIDNSSFYLVGVQHLSTGLDNLFNVIELSSIVSLLGERTIILANRIIDEYDLASYLVELDKVNSLYHPYFLVSDLGIYLHLKKNNLESKVIYENLVSSTSVYEAKFFSDAFGVVLKNNIYFSPLAKEIKNSICQTQYNLIYRSKRRILESYYKYTGLKVEYKGDLFETQSKCNLAYYSDNYEYRIYNKIKDLDTKPLNEIQSLYES